MPRQLRSIAQLSAITLMMACLTTSSLAADREEARVVWERFAARLETYAPIKRIQVLASLSEPMREKTERQERMRELRKLARELKRSGRSTLSRRRDSASPEVLDEDIRLGRSAAHPAPSRIASPARSSATPPNARANDRTGDASDETQSEASIAAYGRYMVAAWNDSKGWPFADAQGWATSIDGGLSWTDRGTVPKPTTPAGWQWASDPMVAVNPSTGAFYFCALGDATGGLNGVGVLKGRFTGDTFAWTKLTAARSALASAAFLDKQWLAVDANSGRVYLTYTNFTLSANQIEVQAADSALTTWSAAVKVSTDAEAGYVQGSRVVVGPNGTACVTYRQIGPVDLDYLRFCRSADGGATFTVPSNAISFYSNFFTGAPGFNRAENNNPHFPALAVDGSAGAHSGRLYLAWPECLNWYNDVANVGTGGSVTEVETNDSPATATAFSVGQVLRGTASAIDFDYYKVNLAAGQHVLVAIDSISTSARFAVRVLAVDGTTRLALADGMPQQIFNNSGPTLLWTAPANGAYFVRIGAITGSGGYRLRTGFAARGAERGTDQRDVFVAHSDNAGSTWSTPVRVDDAPVGYDGWLPEVAVDPSGRVYCAWYDWRDAPVGASGGQSSIYVARSTSGGDSWTSLGAVSDTLSDWTNCASALAPNQGDYMSLVATSDKLVTCWSDARGGSPDAYVAVLPLALGAATASLTSAAGYPDRVELEWLASPPDSFRAAVERSTAGGPWVALDTLGAQPNGQVLYTDTDVSPGTTYAYRLGILAGGTVTYAGYASVLVPSGLGLAIRGASPNPTDGVNGSLGFTLAYAEPATLEVFDLTGRLVHSQALSGLAAASHTIPFPLWPSARSGVYLVRISQRGAHATTRVTLVR